MPSHHASSSSGGAQGKVAFIDTEGTFRPERIRAIAERFEMDADAVLDNIVVARAYTHEHQLDLLVSVAALMAEDPFKLLIVDSIMANFRNDFQGRGELADRQQRLGCLLAKIKKENIISSPLRQISEEFNVAVLLTNQVMSDPGGGAMFVSDPKKPVGGHVLAHASTTRISLRKGKAEQRVAKIVQSPNLAEAEASFAISNEGIIEYKD
ncbi:hypothetical protein CEUSTIGMA_g2585.t1 [Chlamydomonas eustigma]|uniref:RecA family profile 1 domain-containing protein n=1 Tax=Chlamydomonas eustigma TaxID=1157962 RepID=A0A250WWF0_9CHLO|nr:hypothetical protein CEUSTIGMA_g2585.t1 [Chlamydomonas eustigma]|eukprot:GAX75141.1 hypothetical protein CEUSTIGMA_g2585.t1 [Chlamydomonas eustigma]